MSVISTGTTLTTAFQVTGDTNGNLVIQTGATPTTALTVSSAQIVNFANPITVAGATPAYLPAMNIVTGTTQTAASGNQYVLTNAAATTVTLPATPSAGDTVYITVANNLTTNVVARNGSNIMSLAQNMTLDGLYAAVQLRYADATRGWVLT